MVVIYKCKKCGSSQTYVQIKAGKRVCQKCGYIENLNKMEEINWFSAAKKNPKD